MTPQDLRWKLDLAATGTGQIAAKQRFEHQHERIALTSSQTLTQHIGTYNGLLSQRYTQNLILFLIASVSAPRQSGARG